MAKCTNNSSIACTKLQNFMTLLSNLKKQQSGLPISHHLNDQDWHSNSSDVNWIIYRSVEDLWWLRFSCKSWRANPACRDGVITISRTGAGSWAARLLGATSNDPESQQSASIPHNVDNQIKNVETKKFFDKKFRMLTKKATVKSQAHTMSTASASNNDIHTIWTNIITHLMLFAFSKVWRG